VSEAASPHAPPPPPARSLDVALPAAHDVLPGGAGDVAGVPLACLDRCLGVVTGPAAGWRRSGVVA